MARYCAYSSLMYARDVLIESSGTSVLITNITSSSTSRGRHLSSGNPAAANTSDFICIVCAVHSSTADSCLISSNRPSTRCFHAMFFVSGGPAFFRNCAA